MTNGLTFRLGHYRGIPRTPPRITKLNQNMLDELNSEGITPDPSQFAGVEKRGFKRTDRNERYTITLETVEPTMENERFQVDVCDNQRNIRRQSLPDNILARSTYSDSQEAIKTYCAARAKWLQEQSR